MKKTRFKGNAITLLITLSVLSVFIMSCSLSTTVTIQPEPIQPTVNFPSPEPNLVIPDPTLERTPDVEPPDAPPTLESSPTTQPPILYYTQAGDTLNSIGVRFNVGIEEITSTDEVPKNSLIKPGPATDHSQPSGRNQSRNVVVARQRSRQFAFRVRFQPL